MVGKVYYHKDKPNLIGIITRWDKNPISNGKYISILLEITIVSTLSKGRCLLLNKIELEENWVYNETLQVLYGNTSV